MAEQMTGTIFMRKFLSGASSVTSRQILSSFIIAAMVLFLGCGADDKYECIERTQKDNIPNHGDQGTHTEVDYELLHDGHKIYAQCDAEEISDLVATCGFRPLRTYVCKAPPDNIEKAPYPYSDLQCKDGAGHKVYLYVSKKE